MVGSRGHHNFSINGRRIGNAGQCDAAISLFQLPIRVCHFDPECVASSFDLGRSSPSGEADRYTQFGDHVRGCGDLRHRAMVRGVPTVILLLVTFAAGSGCREPIVAGLSGQRADRPFWLVRNLARGDRRGCWPWWRSTPEQTGHDEPRRQKGSQPG